MIFEKASRLKLRFKTGVGLVTAEDLWDMPLTSKRPGLSLDDLAKSLNKAVKESGEESFVLQKSEANSLLDLQFEIVKHVIKVKLEEDAAARAAAADRAKREKLLSIIAKKEDEVLESLSLDELKKMV